MKCPTMNFSCVVYRLRLKIFNGLTCENLICVQLEFESNICVFYHANQKQIIISVSVEFKYFNSRNLNRWTFFKFHFQ
jgi:hypothetical protein